MTDVRWTIKGKEFVNCNCSYGCPCQFNALPTHGFCQAVGGFQIDEGFHGDTRLDGLKFVGMFRWPGKAKRRKTFTDSSLHNHDNHQARRPDRIRCRCSAVHQLLPPG